MWPPALALGETGEFFARNEGNTGQRILLCSQPWRWGIGRRWMAGEAKYGSTPVEQCLDGYQRAREATLTPVKPPTA